jgi:hypothetical protein
VKPDQPKPRTLTGYCVKYALNEGIIPISGESYTGVHGDNYCKTRRYSLLKIGRDFFEERSLAEAVAREMASNKVKSLEKQLTKMRALALAPKWAKEVK